MYKLLLKIFLRIHQKLYNLITLLAMKTEGGLHPKYRLQNYGRFFIDNISKNDKVLDIGCGNGRLTYDIAAKAGKVTGIDKNGKSIKLAKSTFGAPNIEYFEGDALTSLPGREFDLIVMSNLLEHIDERVSFLKGLGNISKKLLIRVPMINRDWITVLKKELGLSWKSDSSHYTEYTLETLRDELQRAGFKITFFEIEFGEIFAAAVCETSQAVITKKEERPE